MTPNTKHGVCALALGFTLLICLPDISDDTDDTVGTKYVPDSVLSALIDYLHAQKIL